MPNLNLEDPLIILGGLWWVGNNKSKFTGGMSGMDILAGGFGAASAQWAGDQVQSLVGADALTDQLSQALAGAALSEWGDRIPRNSAMARGIHLNVAQQAMSGAGLEAGQLLGGGVGGILGGGGGGSSDQESSTNQQTQTNVVTP